MPTDWQAECLRARIWSLEQEIRRVAEKDHPYSEPDAIYHTLLKVLESRLDHFQEACELFSKPNDQRLLDRIFQELTLDVQRVFEIFGYADRVDSPRIPFEFLRCLSWAAKDLLHEECRTVVRLDSAYNYTIVSCRRKFEDLGWGQFWLDATQQSGQDENARSTVLVLGFPSPDAGTTLLHALAAHEFGHEILHRFHAQIEAILEESLVKAKRDHHDELQEYINDNIRRHIGMPQKDAFEESALQLEARLIETSNRWFSEIWSDLVAARLVGPASLAALDRILLNNGAPTDSHPSATLRRRLVHEYLRAAIPSIVDDPVWTSVFPNPAMSTSGGQVSYSNQLAFSVKTRTVDSVLALPRLSSIESAWQPNRSSLV